MLIFNYSLSLEYWNLLSKLFTYVYIKIIILLVSGCQPFADCCLLLRWPHYMTQQPEKRHFQTRLRENPKYHDLLSPQLINKSRPFYET
jgi:hypothetical protein